MAKLSIVGLLLADNTIFDDMVLPAGLDHDLVVSNICNECYDLSVYQPDPDYIKTAIATWSRRRLYAWQKLYNTTLFTYNPIWNKDGTIEETETGNNNGKTFTEAGERGYNDSGIVTNTNAKTDASADHSVNRIRRETGNIGVTSTQSMIKEEREISDFDIVDYITQDFKNQFCILIY